MKLLKERQPKIIEGNKLHFEPLLPKCIEMIERRSNYCSGEVVSSFYIEHLPKQYQRENLISLIQAATVTTQISIECTKETHRIRVNMGQTIGTTSIHVLRSDKIN